MYSNPPQHSASSGFFRRRWLAILIPTLLVPAAAYGFSLLQEKEYEASTALLFRDTGPVLASVEPQREAATNVELLQLPALRTRVAEELGEPLTADVDVIAEAESNVATIFVTDSDPDQAAEVANLYAQEYINLRKEDAEAEIQGEISAVNQALAEIGGPAATPEAQALLDRRQELELASEGTVGVTRLDRAVPPTEASAPKPVRNTLIGAVVGLALGLALAIGLERRDRRVRDPRFMEHILGGPIIGRIPRSRSLARSGPGTGLLPAPEAEAFRTLRANLHRQFHGQGVRSVLVTSAIPREGKTTLAWNLARIEARAGSRVLLVEADLRRPVLARRLEANGAEGLRELLAGDAQLQDLIQTIDIAGETNGATDGGGTLDVLFAGSPP